MATGTVTQGPPPEARRAAHERELVEYEKYIDQQLTKTSRQVQGMDIATGLMCWLAGALVYLLAAAACDHWFFSGGLGTWGRWLALAGLVVGSGWYLARRVLQPLLSRINPVYSAHTIEQGRPQLKNSLVNFLLLRRDTRELSEAVRDALQSQAATGLAAAPVEQAIDRSPLVRFALVLLGAVLVSALYIMFSPKDPLRSAARVMFPWASIERPTRFTIQDIQAEVVETGRKFPGGAADVFYGQRLKISAAVLNRGRVAAEPIVLRFTTADGSANDQPVSLEARERNADILLPAGTLAAAVGGGLQQSFDYTLTAGDAIAGPFHVKVLAAPSIEIESLEYDFPDYTKLTNRKLADRGDVSALEGTRVIVRARANQKIAQAWLDLDCDGRRDATMQANGQEAGVNFLLALKDDRRTPVNSNYLLRFKNEDGFENPQPIRYSITVTPDLAPEIAWESPREIDEPRELPIDEPLEVVFSAGDKDFELASVKLRTQVDTEAKTEQRPWELGLLKKPQAEKWTCAPTAFIPAEHGYKAGETVLVWGEASDNRQPKPNITETAKLKITLLPPRDPAAKRGPNHQPNDGRQQKQPAEGPQDQNAEKQPGENGEPKQGDKQGAQQNGKPEEKEGADNAEKQQPREGERGEEGEPQPGEKGQPQDGDQEKQQPGDGEKKPGEKGSSSEDDQQGGGDSAEAGEGGKNGKGGGQGKESQASESGDETGEGDAGGDASPNGKPSSKQSGKAGEGEAGEKGESGSAGAGDQGSKKSARRVDPDAQDGDAFQRMMEHFNQQDKKNQGKPGEKQAGEQQPGSEDDSQAGDQPGDRDGKQPEKSSTKEGDESGAEKNAAGDKDGQEQKSVGQSGKPDAGAQGAHGGEKAKPDGAQPNAQKSPTEGEPSEGGQQGAQENAGEDQGQSAKPTQDPNAEQSSGDKQPAADEQQTGGAGQQSQKEPKGTPEAQGANKQRDKTVEQQQGKPGESENDAQSTSKSDHQSDTQGGESGSESGGGKEGAGQNADRDGTGSAGSHTEADEGGSAADQSGDGETDGRSGDDQKSAQAKGDKNARQASGKGREGHDPNATNKSPVGGEKGNPAGDKDSAQQPPKEGDQSAQNGTGHGNPNGPRQSGPSQADNSAPSGGQAGEENDAPPAPQQPGPLGSDPANKDYADRATELVLNRLKDQLKKGEPDEALLDKLQWTKQDLERFVKRWEAMKANAKQSGAQGQKAKQELDEALKSLGLRPRGTSTQAGKSRQDQATGIRDNRRSEPPAEYAEQYQQYNVGTSKGK